MVHFYSFSLSLSIALQPFCLGLSDNAVPSKMSWLLTLLITERCMFRNPPVALGITLVVFPNTSETSPTVAHRIL
jgi:hypothetical protein